MGLVPAARPRGVEPGFVWDLLARRAASPARDDVLLIGENGETLTAAQAVAAAEALASALLARGIRPQMTVAWQLDNSIAAALLVLGLARLGVVQAPVPADASETALTSALTAAAAEVLVVQNERGERGGAPAAAPAAGVRLLTLEPGWTLPRAGIRLPPYRRGEWSPRWLFTGAAPAAGSSAVQHTDVSLGSASHALRAGGLLGGGGRDVGALMLPLSSVWGVVHLAALIECGIPIVLMQPHAPSFTVGVLRQFGVTVGCGDSALGLALLRLRRALPRGSRHLVPEVRALLANWRPEVPDIDRLVKRELGITMSHDYGLAEAPLILHGARTGITSARTLHLIGTPVPGIDVRIVRHGVRVRAGISGEIEVTGAGLFAGYSRRAGSAPALTADGWFRTGDRGRLSIDGRLQVLRPRAGSDAEREAWAAGADGRQ
ncbi:AMP-binding protein [Nocardia harenae]|uniref:AMP-binding protein n=1 Tax=Nocardia harenae TaxID=358707 RepID=UPI0008330384|nr:class I adenylate-forming enzyme family protein [Nocardia harenae]